MTIIDIHGDFYFDVYSIKLKTHINYYGSVLGFVYGELEEHHHARIFMHNKIVEIN